MPEQVNSAHDERPILGQPFISISIDLAGSTAYKQLVVNESKKDLKHRLSMYENYLMVLFNAERNFYDLFSHHKDLDLKKLFLIKGIGDELWYSYPADLEKPVEFQRTCAALFEVMLGTFSKSNQLTVTDRYISEEEALDSELDVEIKTFDLPLKGCMDLIKQPIELNLSRYERLHRFVPNWLDRDRCAYGDPEFMALCERLNITSISKTEGNRGVSKVRTDFVGLEIDRFFRLTKFCNPRILAVGQTLIEGLTADLLSAGEYCDHLPVKIFTQRVPHGTGYTTSMNYVIKEKITAAQMKGISDDYSLHHLFNTSSLGSALRMPMPHSSQLMEQSRAFLGEHGFYGLPLPLKF